MNFTLKQAYLLLGLLEKSQEQKPWRTKTVDKLKRWFSEEIEYQLDEESNNKWTQ